MIKGTSMINKQYVIAVIECKVSAIGKESSKAINDPPTNNKPNWE